MSSMSEIDKESISEGTTKGSNAKELRLGLTNAKGQRLLLLAAIGIGLLLVLPLLVRMVISAVGAGIGSTLSSVTGGFVSSIGTAVQGLAFDPINKAGAWVSKLF